MIQSYKDELKIKRRKNIIFWIVVFAFASYLFLFFQGYYLNISFDFKTNEPQKVFKQFGIINILTLPEADNITINWSNYQNNSRSIFDFWNYSVKISKSWYIPVSLNFNINKENTYYTNTINLIKKLYYYPIWESFSSIYKIDNYYLAYDDKIKLVKILDSDFKLKKAFYAKDYIYLWQNYFSLYWKVYIYDFNSNMPIPYLSKVTSLQATCKVSRIISWNLFCYDYMNYISKDLNTNENITKINGDIILTKNYVYNNSNSNWTSYKLENEEISNSENIVHILWLPYFLKDWNLWKFQKWAKEKFEISLIDNIVKAQNFWDELMLIGYKNNQKVFILLDFNRKYSWVFSEINLDNLEISKTNWIYLFKTPSSVYFYYKWWMNLIKIIDWDILDIIWNKIFFKKDNKNYYINFWEE
ncbi:MAG: hypothetical protein ACD_49C00041G0006 [uncultured bacterium (gcode 4)]|uniref:Uncharacterized protein n=1 Tax=uncultured bacterium (gcode 4) TaxID=1234023 RepID=K2BW15_9BACT|nr:MAG: hypothetical protein ACD_49C00041G0006 [uncultured bacterium (gcode 4)]